MSATEAIETTDRSAMESLAVAMENAIDYIGGATASAGASVKTAAGKTGDVIGVGAYKGAYGVSYGLVFGAVFLKELLPAGNVVRRGFEDGAQAAFEAIEDRKVVAEPVDEAAAEPKAKASRRKAAAPAVEG